MANNVVFVAGASGYVGRNVCVAFQKAGFEVFGMVRRKEKAEKMKLAESGINVVVGDMNKEDTWKDQMDKSSIIIDCATTDSADIIRALTKVAGAKKCEDGTKKLYILTTGFRGYAYEEEALKNEQLISCVIRPAFVYGEEGGNVAYETFFKSPNDGLVITGKKDKKWPWVHVRDLAQAYLLAAKQKEKVAGVCFALGTLENSPTFEDLCIGAAKCAGFDGEPTYGDAQGFAAAVDVNVAEFDYSKAKEILGWEMKEKPLMDQLDIVYQEFKKWEWSW